MLRIGDRVTAPVVRQFEEGEVEDISYRFEPHPKDTPFEPYLPPIPTALVNGAWHDIETLKKVTNALPDRDEQHLRAALDQFVTGAVRDISSSQSVKGYSKIVQNDEKSYLHVYVKNGFTYEVSVRCVAWPGMNE